MPRQNKVDWTDQFNLQYSARWLKLSFLIPVQGTLRMRFKGKIALSQVVAEKLDELRLYA